ncbi:MAG TPA: GlsB/YeaQ/YmgE family stress response membrane protein [Pyrinomonadaceae bacterium]
MKLEPLAILISNHQQDSAITFFAWMVIGLLVGFLGSQILNRKGQHLTRYILLSVVGAIVGGFLANLFGKPGIRGLDIYSLIVAAVSALVFLIVYHALFRRKRFLNMS